MSHGSIAEGPTEGVFNKFEMMGKDGPSTAAKGGIGSGSKSKPDGGGSRLSTAFGARAPQSLQSLLELPSDKVPDHVSVLAQNCSLSEVLKRQGYAAPSGSCSMSR